MEEGREEEWRMEGRLWVCGCVGVWFVTVRKKHNEQVSALGPGAFLWYPPALTDAATREGGGEEEEEEEERLHMCFSRIFSLYKCLLLFFAQASLILLCHSFSLS
jgi:hypothetical protein